MDSLGLPCVHCGLCLDTCPTYRVLGTEAESPRGRIYLMEAVENGTLPLDEQTSSHLESCLGCLACETACPSGVSFRTRIESFRPRLQRTPARRAAHAFVQRMSQSPSLLRAALATARYADAFGLEKLRRRLPGLQLMPRKASDAFVSDAPEPRIPPPFEPRARAALLRGCAADVLAPRITRAAVEVLHANGVLVVDVPGQGCCGALALHGGDEAEVQARIAKNAEAFDVAGLDFIVITAAGCGAVMKQYGELVNGNDSLRARARTLADRARDISEVVCTLGLVPPSRPLRFDGPVAYHDACHLLHASKVSAAPRSLLAAAVASGVADLGENHLCCGSAGSYNLEQPALARVLGDRKAELAEHCDAAVIAVGNAGCALQIELALERRGNRLPVVHPVELLAEAYVRSV